jgi:nicotinamidase/pyrazinamidase
LRENGITDVYVCGLARDFCVKWTAEDAADLGFATTVLWDLTRAVNPAHDDVVFTALRGKRVQIGESASLR